MTFLRIKKMYNRSTRIVPIVLYSINSSKEIEHNSYINMEDTIFFQTGGTIQRVFKAFCKYSHLQLLIIKTGKNYGCSQCRESTNGE